MSVRVGAWRTEKPVGLSEISSAGSKKDVSVTRKMTLKYQLVHTYSIPKAHNQASISYLCGVHDHCMITRRKQRKAS